MNNKLVGLMLVLGALSVQGCAHGKSDKNLDERLSRENTVKNSTELRAEATDLIETTPGLSAEQKTKLTALRDSVRTQNDDLREQSLKLRSVLIKDVISTSYNEKEVELVKKRIKTVENKRLAVLFDAVDKANKILGRQASANQKVVRDMLMMDMGRRSAD